MMSIHKILRYAVAILVLGSTFLGSFIGGSAYEASYQRTSQDGEEYILAITFSESSQLRKVLEHDFLVLDIQEDMIYAYASAQDAQWLSQAGFSYHDLEENDLKKLGFVQRPEFERQFHTYSTMTAELQDIASLYPDITELVSLGQSVQGRELWGLKVTDNPELEENEVEIRFCGAHHGNEHMSVELPLFLAWHLAENYGSDPTITEYVNTREIWIIPMVNPDGREADTRRNANNVDLNRDYGYMWDGSGSSPSPFSQPETQAIRDHALINNFVISYSYHTTAAYVNYVWNYKGQETPDHDYIDFISDEYEALTGYESILGYDWYQVRGDTNDFSYGCRGDLDTTIETANSDIPGTWNLNREAMLLMIEYADIGLHGIVTDAITGDPLEATVWVEEAYWPCFTDPAIGDYHKPLFPGTYTVHYQANGYEEQIHVIEVTSIDDPTIFNVALSPSNEYYAFQVTWVNYYDPYYYPNNFNNNPTEAVWALGPPDGLCASLGRGGSLVLDMKESIEDGEGNEFTVYEGDGESDGYAVYVATYWDGPYTFLDDGLGTTAFDLADGPVSTAQYIKIIDDNDGSAYDQNPGCDIDAVQHFVFSIPGDANGDGVVNVEDLLIVLGQWGTAGPEGDVNFDGIVNVEDLLMVLANWTR